MKPFLGPVKSMAELHSAAQALQAAYHKAGHLITQVTLPEQEIQDDIVTLKVIEGRVSNVAVLVSYQPSLYNF
jgi:hemolysin activation/secretion protein